ncbi:transcriptional regulator, partial [Pseudomonadota bacterium]
MLLNPTTGSNQEKGAEHRRYSFGEFALDIDRGALLRDGEDVQLRPKSFEVLRQLVEHAGVLLSKRDLLAAVWPGVIVTDDSLTQCLIDIRKALGDTSKEIVRTVPRRGYLFDIPVEAQEPSEGATHSPAPAKQERTRRPSRWSMGAFAVLTIAIAATWWSIGQRSPPQAMPREMPVAAPENSIAVLPTLRASSE